MKQGSAIIVGAGPAGLTAGGNIVNDVPAKDNIWAVNTAIEHHEEKAGK